MVEASWPLMRRILREGVRPYIGRILLSLFFMALVAATTAMSAWLMDPVVNKVFVDKDTAMLWPIGVGVLVTFLVKGLATYAQSNLLSYVGLRIVADMQNRLFAHLMRMDLSFYHATTTGRLVSRMTNDVNLMRGIVSNSLTSLGKDTLSVIFLIGVTFYQDWILASVAFVVFPIAILPVVRLGRRMRRVTANTQEHMGQFMTLLEQSFMGIRVVKTYAMEPYERGKIAAITESIVRLMYKAARVRAASGPIMETLGGVAIVIVVLYGGSRVIDGETTAGAFFSFITALLMVSNIRYYSFKKMNLSKPLIMKIFVLVLLLLALMYVYFIETLACLISLYALSGILRAVYNLTIFKLKNRHQPRKEG